MMGVPPSVISGLLPADGDARLAIGLVLIVSAVALNLLSERTRPACTVSADG
jgi:hypothetical protein